MAENQDLIDYFKSLPQGERQGPASEATLAKLLEITAKGLKIDLKKGDMGNLLKGLGKRAEAEEDATDVIQDFTYEMRKGKRGLYALGVGFQALSGQVIDLKSDVGDFANSLDRLANASGNAYFKLFTEGFSKLAEMIDIQVDNFKQLSEVGIQFGEGLFTTRELALQAGLTLDSFTNAVATSANTLAVLSGSVRGGTQRFAEISNVFQKEFRVQAAGLGMTFEETTALLTDYLEIQTNIGNAQTLSNRQLISGAKEFTLQLDQLSAITGKQRKQIAEQLKQDMLDKRLQGIFQSLENSAIPGVQNILGSLQGLPSETQNAVKELIGTGGVPLSDFAKSLVRLNPQLSGFFRRVSQGQGSVAEFEAMIRMTAARSQAQGAGIQRQSALLAVLGDQTLAANAELFRFTEFGKQRNAVEKAQTKATQAISNQILDFRNSLKDIQNFFITALLPVLKVFGFALGNLAKAVNFLMSPFINAEGAMLKFIGSVGAAGLALGALIGASKLLGATFSGLGSIFGKMMPALGGGRGIAGGAKALGAVGPKAALGGVFAGAGVGAFAGLAGAGAGLGIAAIGKGLQTFNDVNSDNLSRVADATKKLMATLVSGVTNPIDVTRSVSGLRDYAKTVSQVLDDLDKDKLSVYTQKLEDLAGAFKEVNSSMSGAITTTGRTSTDKLDAISTILQEIKVVMEDVRNSNKQISRKTTSSNMYNT